MHIQATYLYLVHGKDFCQVSGPEWGLNTSSKPVSDFLSEISIAAFEMPT